MKITSWLKSLMCLSHSIGRRGCHGSQRTSTVTTQHRRGRRPTQGPGNSIAGVQLLENRCLLSGFPVLQSVVISGDGITAGTGDLNAGQHVGIYYNFDSDVTVTPTTGHFPTLTLNDGATAAMNFASSGTMSFVYNISAGENTADLTIVAFNLNGATIQGNGLDADLTGAVTNPAGILQIDTTAPTASISLTGSEV